MISIPKSLHRAFGSWTFWTAVVVACTALFVRLAAVRFGLPYFPNADEPTNLRVGISMLADGSLNPGFFSYPSLLFEVISSGAWILAHLGVNVPADAGLQIENMGVVHSTAPKLVIGLRTISVVCSVATCILVYFGALLVTDRPQAAAIGSLLLALSPLAVENGVYITPDVYSGLACVIALIGCISMLRNDFRRSYILMGFGTGLSLGSKYNILILVPVLLAVYLLRRRWKTGIMVRLFIAAGAALITFMITTPTIIVNPREVLHGVNFEWLHYANGHPGYEGDSLTYYVAALFRDVPALVISALFAPLALFDRRFGRYVAVLLSYVVSYFGLIAHEYVHFDRNLIPLTAALALLAPLVWCSTIDRARSFLPHGVFPYALISVCSASLAYKPVLLALLSNSRRL